MKSITHTQQKWGRTEVLNNPDLIHEISWNSKIEIICDNLSDKRLIFIRFFKNTRYSNEKVAEISS